MSRTTRVTCVIPRGAACSASKPASFRPPRRAPRPRRARPGRIAEDEVRPEGGILAYGHERARRAADDQILRRRGRDALPERAAEAWGGGLPQDVQRRGRRSDADRAEARRNAKDRAQNVGIGDRLSGRQREGLLAAARAVLIVAEEPESKGRVDAARVRDGQVRLVERAPCSRRASARGEKPNVGGLGRGDRFLRQESAGVVRHVVDGRGVSGERAAGRRRRQDHAGAPNVRRDAQVPDDARRLRHAERRKRVPLGSQLGPGVRDERHVHVESGRGGVGEDQVRPEGLILAHAQDRAGRATRDQVRGAGGRDALAERAAEAGSRRLTRTTSDGEEVMRIAPKFVVSPKTEPRTSV